MESQIKSIVIDPTTIGATLAPCEAAEARAAADGQFKTLLDQMRGAGAVYGASQGKGESKKLFAALADSISGPALVVLGLRHKDDGELGADLLPTAEAAPALLVELFGLVQEAVKAAQKAAAKAMRSVGQGSKAKAAEASARKSITQGVNRVLAGYGIHADFFACRIEEVEAAEEDSEEEKAAKALAAALTLNFLGALGGFAELDVNQLKIAAERIEQYRVKAVAEAEAAAQAAKDKAKAEAEAIEAERQRVLAESQARDQRKAAAELVERIRNGELSAEEADALVVSGQLSAKDAKSACKNAKRAA